MKYKLSAVTKWLQWLCLAICAEGPHRCTFLRCTKKPKWCHTAHCGLLLSMYRKLQNVTMNQRTIGLQNHYIISAVQCRFWHSQTVALHYRINSGPSRTGSGCILKGFVVGVLSGRL